MQNQNGQVTPLIGIFILLLAVSVSVLFWLNIGAGIRAKSQAVADAAALSGVAHGKQSAAQIANANGGSLIAFVKNGNEVKVQTNFRGVLSVAAARQEGSIGNEKLPPALRVALARTEQLTGHRIAVLHSSTSSITISKKDANRASELSADGGLCRESGTTFVVCGS